MKTVTVHVDEAEYAEFRRHARRAGRTASAQLRETIHAFNEKRRGEGLPSLADAPPPVSAGRVRKPWSGREDLLEGFLDRS